MTQLPVAEPGTLRPGAWTQFELLSAAAASLLAQSSGMLSQSSRAYAHLQQRRTTKVSMQVNNVTSNGSRNGHIYLSTGDIHQVSAMHASTAEQSTGHAILFLSVPR